MIKKVKCNVCNYKFYIDKSKIIKVSYIKNYDAIDCPNCGCQKILWPRIPEIKSKNYDCRNGRDM